MTVEKAIEEVQFNMSRIGLGARAARRVREAKEMAIQALEEIEQYRAIGTIEEFKSLKEKAEPKKPIRKPNHDWTHEVITCPTCNGHLSLNEHHCRCGQKIEME